MEATPKGPQGNPVSGYTITWTSENTTVAVVESDGDATGQSPGSTTITASAERGDEDPLSGQSEITVEDQTEGNTEPLVADLQPAEYTTDTTETGEEVYVDRGFLIDAVPGQFENWTYVRTANDDKSVQDASAVTLTLTDTATVALAYDERATTLPSWLESWTDTGKVLETTDVGHDIFTRVFGPGDVVLGGNQSGGAKGAGSMYVLFTAPSNSAPDQIGSLEVSASTSGDDPDPDGYTATVDGSNSQDLGANGTVTFSGLEEGEHQVELSGVQPNCSVEGSNPRTVTVDPNSTVSTGFSVSCSSTTGTLEVSASTTGDEQDPDGYTATVDGSSSQDLGSNGTVTFSGLSEGDHSVELSGIASNCSVDGSNPRTVTVEAGGTVSTTFNVNCTATTGSLEVSASTSGDDQDSDGYTVTVGSSSTSDGSDPPPPPEPGSDDATSKNLGPNGTVTFSGLSEGEHQVELSGVASNCSVDGENPRTITVESDNTVSTTFNVGCTTQSGDLEVSASTTGDDQDSDGYTATVDGNMSKDLGPNGTATFSDLSEGDHSVELSGIKSNCSADGSNPKTISVTAGNTASATFSVSCEGVSGPAIESATINSAGSQITIAFDQAVTLGPNHEDAHLNPIDDTPYDNPTMSYASGEGTSSLIFDLSRTFLQGETPSIHYDQPGDGIQATDSGIDLSSFSDFAVTNNSTQGGTLEVSASTSGDDQDSDGYTVTVDGSNSKSIGPNGSASFSGLSEGNHSVELSGLKSNCSVDGSNPKTVSVTAGNTASTTFNVSCTATTGSLEVSASTSGDDQDPDGYTATVDGSNSQDLGPNGTVTFSGLSEGDHSVELTGIASNCSVDGSNPKTVSVTVGSTVSTTFNVSCTATTGSLDVSASTSGDDQDPDGYTATVDGSSSQDLGPNGTVTFSGLSEGDHSVELSGIASNCSVDGSNPRTVTVEAGGTVSTTFNVSCTALTGNLEVSASTTGEDQDPDGYTATVDGSNSQDLGPNGTVTFSGLSEGDHQVELSGIASNCSVDGSNPKTVSVTAGGTVSTTFNVSCTATTGSLDVSASTSGDDQDPDGYTATVDGSSSQDLGPNGTVTFSGLSEGDHSVELSGIASNCSVDGSNPRTVTVEAGSTVSTTFNVSCTALTGNLEVSASTTGEDQDPDGYTATVDGSNSQDLGPNGTVTFSGLSEGDHQVELSGIASNCSVDGSNPKTVSVTAGGTVSTTFNVSCTATTGSLDVSASTSGDDQDPDGYTATVDGSTSKDIGPNGSTTFSGLSEGDHSVELSGIKSNCSVDGSNPKTVSVTAGNTVSTSFSVNCEATGGLSEVAIPSDSDWSSETAIIQPGPAGAWDERLAGAAPGSVVKKDGTYYLYYVGAAGDRSSDGGPAKRAVGLATCDASADPTDPSNWSKHPDNPVIPWSEINNNGDEEEGAWGVAAYVDGSEIIAYVTHLEGGGGSVTGPMYLWTSTDGVNLTNQGKVIPTDGTFPGDDEVNPLGVHKEDGTWHLFYVAKGSSTSWTISKATGSARDNFTAGLEVEGDPTHRYGGDVSIIKRKSSETILGISIGRGAKSDTKFYTLSDSDNFESVQTTTKYGFDQSWESVIHLDREQGQWLGFHGDEHSDIGDENVDAIDIRTAPVTYED